MATDNQSKQKTKSNNKNRQRYRPNNKSVKKGAYPLRPGVQGFYITCDGGRERQASQEAVNVIDSFYEELVQGTNSNLGQVELSEKPVNKKTVFKYSNSSSSDDDYEDGENGNDEDQTKEETLKIEQHQEKIGDEIDSLKTGESGPENKDNTSTDDELIQGNTKNKEELEKYSKAAEAGNIVFGKTEEKSIDRLIDAELGDKSKRQGDPNPKEIVQHMLSSLALTKKHVSRFILRVLPVERHSKEVCTAIYEARANTGINKMKIIDAVAKSVPSPHKVDLSNPEINIVVQIVKTVCLLGELLKSTRSCPSIT
ncbi:hypothetical protein H5410_004252 [Solanum commersonii]|uniref:THUMP domain-containing protein n=1 Tax=Solanum commersonii TaxID=4109 RepID=A0A9J6B7Z7_SOLCO|nr:hypothetical protein H5410_004252 [Solanum commersonii]